MSACRGVVNACTPTCAPGRACTNCLVTRRKLESGSGARHRVVLVVLADGVAQELAKLHGLRRWIRLEALGQRRDEFCLFVAEDVRELCAGRRSDVPVPLRLEEASKGLPAEARLPGPGDVAAHVVGRGPQHASAQDLRRLPNLEAQAVRRHGHLRHAAPARLHVEAAVARGRAGGLLARAVVEPHRRNEARDGAVVIVPTAPIGSVASLVAPLCHRKVVQQSARNHP
mmetsp:Transcript_80315/g.250483  ORF Transcript_80315/g.250483 Transcript_80315/m.250483 type:complete len:228 (-) Transcript_80315:634-1317(-)